MLAQELVDRMKNAMKHKVPAKTETKLEAAEKRIAELEAKLANPVLLPKTNGYPQRTHTNNPLRRVFSCSFRFNLLN